MKRRAKPDSTLSRGAEARRWLPHPIPRPERRRPRSSFGRRLLQRRLAARLLPTSSERSPCRSPQRSRHISWRELWEQSYSQAITPSLKVNGCRGEHKLPACTRRHRSLMLSLSSTCAHVRSRFRFRRQTAQLPPDRDSAGHGSLPAQLRRRSHPPAIFPGQASRFRASLRLRPNPSARAGGRIRPAAAAGMKLI